MSPTKKVVVTLAGLTPPQASLIMIQHTDIYAPFVVLNQNHRIGLEQFFSLRGQDLPPNCPEWMLHQSRKPCVFGFWDDEHMTEGTFVGARLTPDPHKKTPAASQNTSKKKPNKGKGRATLPASNQVFQKASNDGVKASFHLDSQTPHIGISVKKSAIPGETAILSTKLFAQDLACNADGQVQIYIRPSERYPLTEAQLQPKLVIDAGGNASTGELKHLAANNQLVELVFFLKEHKRYVWSGLPLTEINAIHSRTPAQSKTENTRSRDLVIQNLDRCRLLSIYMSCKDLEELQAMQKMCSYMVDLFSLCAYIGNFWFYRMLLNHNKKNPHDIERPELPRINYIIPRWLVKSWQFEETNTSQGVFWANPVAHRWASFRALKDYRNPNEAAFLLKLGILGEQQRQTRALNELV